MIQLIAGVVTTQVEDIEPELAQQVDDAFAVFTHKYEFAEAFLNGNWDGKRHFFTRQTGTLPTGLLPLLLRLLQQWQVPYTIRKNFQYQPPKQIITRLPGYDLASPPYDYQARAVVNCLKRRRGVLRFATNSGKTIIAAALIESLQQPALFLCGSRDILMQTADVFAGTLSLNVGCYGAGKKQLREVTVGTVQSLVRLTPRQHQRKFENFRILIIDETHHGRAVTYRKVAKCCTQAVWRFGLSGTPFTGRRIDDWKLIAATGPLIGTVSNQMLIERGISAKPTVHYLKSRSDQEYYHSEPGTTALEAYTEAFQQGIIHNRKRNRQIRKLAQHCLNKGQKVVVLTSSEVHGFQLQEEFESIPDPVWFNSGRTAPYIRREVLQEFRSEGGVLIATGIYDEGIDAPEIDVLILAGSGKKEREVLQRIGRALRRKQDRENVAHIYDFIDYQNHYLLRHSLRRAAHCLNEEFEVRAPISFLRRAEWER